MDAALPCCLVVKASVADLVERSQIGAAAAVAVAITKTIVE